MLPSLPDAALNLINKSGTIFSLSTNNGLLSFLFEVQSTPQVIDQVLDSQRIVDNKIKNLCELFIDFSVRLILRRLHLVRNQLVSCSRAINTEGTSFKSADQEIRSDAQNDARQTDGGSVENRTETMALPPAAASDEQTSAERVDKSVDSKANEPERQADNEDESKNGVAEKRTTDTSGATEDHQTKQRTSAGAASADQQLSGVQQLASDLNALIREANEQVISVQKSMKIYLASEDTEAILFKPVKNHIVKSIENLFSQLALVLSEQELNECSYTSPKEALEAILRTYRSADRPNW